MLGVSSVYSYNYLFDSPMLGVSTVYSYDYLFDSPMLGVLSVAPISQEVKMVKKTTVKVTDKCCFGFSWKQ